MQVRCIHSQVAKTVARNNFIITFNNGQIGALIRISFKHFESFSISFSMFLLQTLLVYLI